MFPPGLVKVGLQEPVLNESLQLPSSETSPPTGVDTSAETRPAQRANAEKRFADGDGEGGKETKILRRRSSEEVRKSAEEVGNQLAMATMEAFKQGRIRSSDPNAADTAHAKFRQFSEYAKRLQPEELPAIFKLYPRFVIEKDSNRFCKELVVNIPLYQPAFGLNLELSGCLEFASESSRISLRARCYRAKCT